MYEIDIYLPPPPIHSQWDLFRCSELHIFTKVCTNEITPTLGIEQQPRPESSCKEGNQRDWNNTVKPSTVWGCLSKGSITFRGATTA
jgi:hypothetical protein